MLRATAPAFDPQQMRSPCQFLQQGACPFGNSCKYLHTVEARPGQIDQEITVSEEEEQAREMEKLALTKNERAKGSQDGTTCVRKICGAVITFGIGAEVTNIEIPSKHKYGKWVQYDSVICSWYRPAGMALLTYNDLDLLHEAGELLLKTTTPSGRNLDCVVRRPGRNDRNNQSTLEVRNLEAECGEEWFKNILGTIYPLKIKIREPPLSAPPDESREVVQGLLQSFGELKNCRFNNDPARPTFCLSASFSDPKNAITAVQELNGSHHEDIGRLSVRSTINIKFNVPSRMVMVLLPELVELQRQSSMEHRVRLILPGSKDHGGPVRTLRIEANGTDAPNLVAKVKAQLEKLLAGTDIKHDGAPLWHSFFGSTDALLYLSRLSHTSKLYIHRDARKSQLRLYGGIATIREQVRKILVAKVAELKQSPQIWVLTADEFKTAVTGGFSNLESVLDKKVTLDVASTPKKILVQGSKKDLAMAKSIFHGEKFHYEDDEVSPPGVPVALPDDCCACWTEPEPEEVLNIACGHTYCRECFLNQVASCEFPFRCATRGDEGRCSHVFSLQELRTLLDFDDFESLLEASLKTYVRTNSTLFQYCPTPDCPSIHCLPARPSAENRNATQESASPTSFRCTACLTIICAQCIAIYHDGMTCAEYKDSPNLEALQALKREMGWKDCPRCETSIEKTEGCNHVACTACGVHICWVCLQTFEDSNTCYLHLTDVHGGLGLLDNNEAIEDFLDFEHNQVFDEFGDLMEA